MSKIVYDSRAWRRHSRLWSCHPRKRTKTKCRSESWVCQEPPNQNPWQNLTWLDTLFKMRQLKFIHFLCIWFVKRNAGRQIAVLSWSKIPIFVTFVFLSKHCWVMRCVNVVNWCGYPQHLGDTITNDMQNRIVTDCVLLDTNNKYVSWYTND